MPEPTQEQVEAAAKAVMAEWKVMAGETGYTHISWPVSPANYRLLRAALTAALTLPQSLSPKERRE